MFDRRMDGRGRTDRSLTTLNRTGQVRMTGRRSFSPVLFNHLRHTARFGQYFLCSLCFLTHVSYSFVFLDQGTFVNVLGLSQASRMTPNKGSEAPSVSSRSDRASGMSRTCLTQTNT